MFYSPLLHPYHQNQNTGRDQDHESLRTITFHPFLYLLELWDFMCFSFCTVQCPVHWWHRKYLTTNRRWLLQTKRSLLTILTTAVPLKPMGLCFGLNAWPEASLYEHAQVHTNTWVGVSPFGGIALPAQDAVTADTVFLWSTAIWQHSQWYLGPLAWVKRVGFGSLCGCICFVLNRSEQCI